MNGITPTIEPKPRYRVPQTSETGRISTASRTRSVFLARRSSSSSGRTPITLRRAVRPQNRRVIACTATKVRQRSRPCCEPVDIESEEWQRSTSLHRFPVQVSLVVEMLSWLRERGKMKKALAIVLIFGFVLVDFLFFHDVFKPGETRDVSSVPDRRAEYPRRRHLRTLPAERRQRRLRLEEAELERFSSASASHHQARP